MLMNAFLPPRESSLQLCERQSKPFWQKYERVQKAVSWGFKGETGNKICSGNETPSETEQVGIDGKYPTAQFLFSLTTHHVCQYTDQVRGKERAKLLHY